MIGSTNGDTNATSITNPDTMTGNVGDVGSFAGDVVSISALRFASKCQYEHARPRCPRAIVKPSTNSNPGIGCKLPNTTERPKYQGRCTYKRATDWITM